MSQPNERKIMDSKTNKIVDVPSEDINDEALNDAPKSGGNSASANQSPAEDDKFMKFTRKATAGTEKVVGEAYAKVKDVIGKGNFDPRRSIGLIDRLIDWTKTTFPPEKFEALSNWFAKYGHGALVCAQVLTLVYFVIAAVVTKSWPMLFVGAGFATLLVMLQYTADKFLHAGDTLIKSSPSRLSSVAFLDCLALLVEAFGLLAVIYAITLRQWSLFIVGLGVWAICDAIAYIAINPSLANIKISKDTAAGEEAIGILSFIVKAIVRMVPFAFGVGAIAGSVSLLVASIGLMFKENAVVDFAHVGLIVVCACLPFASYVLFTVYHLIIDVLRAILVIPGKLDKLNS